MEKICKCCNKSFKTKNLDEQLCDKCFQINVKELYDSKNSNLTIQEFKEKIKKQIIE